MTKHLNQLLPPSTADERDVRVWVLVLGYLVGAAIAFSAAGFYIALADAIAMGGLTILGAAVSIAAIRAMPDGRLPRAFNTLSQQAVYGLASAMLTYAAACSNRPLADSTMLSIDRALGYDWRAYIGATAALPALARLLTAAYGSLFWQMFLITVVASMRRDRRLLQEFVMANVFVLWLTIALFTLFPVTTAWVHLHASPDTLRALHLRADGGWPQQLLAIRAGTVGKVTPMSNFAIIGFPSYHCSAGLINVWVAWRCRWLRWPIIAMTVPMIAATPVNGGHYVIDLAAAVVVTQIAITLAKRFVRRARSVCQIATWSAS